MKVKTQLTEAALGEGFTSLAPFTVAFRNKADTPKIQQIMMKYGDVTQTKSAKTPIRTSSGFALTFQMDPEKGTNFIRDIGMTFPGDAKAWKIQGD
jgi:hypothetical protein